MSIIDKYREAYTTLLSNPAAFVVIQYDVNILAPGTAGNLAGTTTGKVQFPAAGKDGEPDVEYAAVLQAKRSVPELQLGVDEIAVDVVSTRNMTYARPAGVSDAVPWFASDGAYPLHSNLVLLDTDVVASEHEDDLGDNGDVYIADIKRSNAAVPEHRPEPPEEATEFPRSRPLSLGLPQNTPMTMTVKVDSGGNLSGVHVRIEQELPTDPRTVQSSAGVDDSSGLDPGQIVRDYADMIKGGDDWDPPPTEVGARMVTTSSITYTPSPSGITIGEDWTHDRPSIMVSGDGVDTLRIGNVVTTTNKDAVEEAFGKAVEIASARDKGTVLGRVLAVRAVSG